MESLQGRLFMLFAAIGPAAYFFPAPFGRYSTRGSAFAIDGKIAWVVQEIIAPAILFYHLSLFQASFHTGQWIAILMFIGHYLNRALIWPLFIMPSISPSHV